MNCPRCRTDNPDMMKYCVQCGNRLVINCPGCAAEMLQTYRFCGECGKPLGSSAGRPPEHATPAAVPEAPMPEKTPLPAETGAPSSVSHEGERKQVTVLRCALEAVEASTPDAMHEILSRFLEVARDQVARYGGTVHSILGQGFMALFGAPVAYEDHPQRAMLAAVGIRQKVLDGSPGDGLSWSVSMGLDTGSIVIGGGDMAIGEATDTAARLRRQAMAGEILISGRTARLIGRRAALEKLEPTVGNDGETLEVWRVSMNTDLGTPSPFADSSATPFVGRVRELSVLEQLRDRAREGQGQVVAVTGPAGSGKSRLLHYLYRRTFFGDERTSYVRGQCVSYATGVPYRPLADMIRKASRISESDSPAEIAIKLQRSLQTVGTDNEETLPFLLRLLGAREGTEALDELEPQAIQARTFAAMRRMLLDASRKALMVVEIEDLQWIDATSAEFLDSLIEVMAPTRLLVLLTYRSGYQPQWLDKSYATSLNMGQLSEADSLSLVQSLLERAGHTGEPPPELLEKAEGNPFFLEEMARALIDRSGGDGASADSASADSASGEAVPDTIQGILMARIDRLPDEHKQLLRTASVLGRELPLELLREIWDRPAELEPLLEDLQRWELLYKAPSEDKVTYFFHQALTQEVTYGSLLAARRESLHRRVAQKLESLFRDRLEEVYDRLIYHYPKAGQPEKTIHYLTLFAKRAAGAYAHAEAAQALREALDQVDKLPEAERDRRSIEVLLQLAESLLPLASFPETLELFRKYLDRLESLDDPQLAGQYYFWLAHTYTYLGMQEETRSFAEKSIAAARECHDETTEGKACYVLGRDGFWSGQFQTGVENSLRAVVLLERNGEPWWQGQAYWVAGFNHYVLGQFEQAIDAIERTLALGEALDDVRLDSSWSLGYFYASLGEAETGIEKCRSGLERAKDPLNSAVSAGFLGHALLQKGDDSAAAIEHLEPSTALMKEAGMQQLEGWFASILGEAYLAQKDLEKAQASAERALRASEEANFLYGVGLAQAALARVAVESGDTKAAHDWFGKGRQCFEELQVPFEVARADLELGRLARLAGDTDEAAELFQRARGTFDTLRLPFWVERAESMAAAD